jgi:hypothetical protein
VAQHVGSEFKPQHLRKTKKGNNPLIVIKVLQEFLGRNLFNVSNRTHSWNNRKQGFYDNQRQSSHELELCNQMEGCPGYSHGGVLGMNGQPVRIPYHHDKNYDYGRSPTGLSPGST